MIKQETAKIVAYLYELYPNGEPVTDARIEAWHMLMKDYNYHVVQSVLPEVVREWTGYTMPPIGVIIRKIEIAKPDDLFIDLWNEAEQLISRGTILTAEEFEHASPEVKRYFGSIARIRELALMPSEETANERARFLRQVPAIRENIKTRQALPENVLSLIDGVAKRRQLT